jgi:hypothetical protein
LEETTVSEATTAAAPARTQNGRSPLILSILPLLILFGAAATLFWLSTQDPAGTYKYWEIFVPVVAVLSVFSGWNQSQMMGTGRLWYLIRQFIHWGAVIGLLYLFNVVGFREMLSDQQYTVILVGVLAVATLLAAIQMDFMLVLFALFLAFCTYVYFAPSDNAALTAVGGVFRIADPQTNAATVTAVLAAAGFIASLIILYMMPRSGSSGQAPVATPTETSTD